MHTTEGADYSPVSHHYVTSAGGAVGQDRVVSDADIVGDVGISHDQIVVADLRDQSSALGPAMNGDKLANFVSIPNACLGRLPLIFRILGGDADCGIGIDDIVVANLGDTLDVDVRQKPRTRSDIHAGSDDAVGSDLRAIGNTCSCVDNCARMNRHGRPQGTGTGSSAAGEATNGSRSCSLHISTASATTTPSTVALPCIFAMLALRLVTCISMRS